MLTNIIEETTYLICAGEKADELSRKSISMFIKKAHYHVLERCCIQKEAADSDVYVSDAGTVEHFARDFSELFRRSEKG